MVLSKTWLCSRIPRLINVKRSTKICGRGPSILPVVLRLPPAGPRRIFPDGGAFRLPVKGTYSLSPSASVFNTGRLNTAT